MKIAIIGSRAIPESFVLQHLEFLLDEDYGIFLTVISGGALGVDTYVKNFCDKNQIPIEVIRPINPADKTSYLFRNVEILTKADKVIAFWDGQSRGTKFVIDYCKAREKDLKIVEFKNE